LNTVNGAYNNRTKKAMTLEAYKEGPAPKEHGLGVFLPTGDWHTFSGKCELDALHAWTNDGTPSYGPVERNKSLSKRKKVDLTLESELPSFWWEWGLLTPSGDEADGEKFFDEETRRKFDYLTIPGPIRTAWVGLHYTDPGDIQLVTPVSLEYFAPPCTDVFLSSTHVIRTVSAVRTIHISSYKWVDNDVVMTDTRWRGAVARDDGKFKDIIYEVAGCMHGKGVTWMEPSGRTFKIQVLEEKLSEFVCT
jgi:hypothetical protein